MWDKNLLKKDCKRFGGIIIFLLTFVYICHFCNISLCPLKRLIGYPCPLCGITRASIFLFLFQFQKAFEMNPSIFCILCWIIYLLYNRYLHKTNYKKKIFFSFIILILLIFLIYGIKMFWYFPIQEPYTYNHNNWLFLIKEK